MYLKPDSLFHSQPKRDHEGLLILIATVYNDFAPLLLSILIKIFKRLIHEI